MPDTLPSLATRNVLGLPPAEMLAHLPEGERKPYRARQIAHWIYARGTTDFSAMTNLPDALRRHAAARLTCGQLALERRRVAEARDATKYLWRTRDGLSIESVHLVMAEGEKDTLCISSQVGCAYGCTFCATGAMGFTRHLDRQEIVEQVYRMREELWQRPGPPPRVNVVFMGMGEPLANYDQVLEAIRFLVDPDGLALGERRITVSTVGLAERIHRLADEGLKVGLAISLNATTNETRAATMPVTRKHGIEEVLEAGRTYAQKTGRRVTLEYVLLRGENDSLEDAERLRAHAAQLPSKINVIPLNPFPGVRHERPDTEWVERFMAQLTRGQAPAVTLRATRGRDIAAACGQLAATG